METFYTSIDRMKSIFDQMARQKGLKATNKHELEMWSTEARSVLWELLGMDKMGEAPFLAQIIEKVEIEAGITREKIVIQVEPGVFMPFYVLIPPKQEDNKKLRPLIAACGHQGGGKLSVAGRHDLPIIKEKIEFFNYDYGLEAAKNGYVALCPDARGFGERREMQQQSEDEKSVLTCSCFNLAHMAFPLGMTVAGMCTWDLMRLIDYIIDRDEWDTTQIGVIGFSGGGMQALMLSALDERLKYAVISGYMYGYKDSLLELNGNCSCNYVPKLWEKYDMGDIGALIAPRPLLIQSCEGDHLNGPRGIINAKEQVDIVKQAYLLYEENKWPIHDICPGGHAWHHSGPMKFLTELLKESDK